MPGISGTDLAKQIKEENLFFPMIALSSIDSFVKLLIIYDDKPKLRNVGITHKKLTSKHLKSLLYKEILTLLPIIYPTTLLLSLSFG